MPMHLIFHKINQSCKTNECRNESYFFHRKQQDAFLFQLYKKL